MLQFKSFRTILVIKFSASSIARDFVIFSRIQSTTTTITKTNENNFIRVRVLCRELTLASRKNTCSAHKVQRTNPNSIYQLERLFVGSFLFGRKYIHYNIIAIEITTAYCVYARCILINKPRPPLESSRMDTSVKKIAGML